MKFEYYGWKSRNYVFVQNTDTVMSFYDIFCDPANGISTYETFAAKNFYSSSDLQVIQDVTKRIKRRAN
jgi:hypothetical protein